LKSGQPGTKSQGKGFDPDPKAFGHQKMPQFMKKDQGPDDQKDG
jgi:hypothetical protein